MQENLHNKKYYKADELASILGVKKFVLRTWESQFDLNKSNSQYNDDDLEVFVTIKELLYEKKLSPTLAKEQLPLILNQKIKQAQAIETKIEPKLEQPQDVKHENLVAATRTQPVMQSNEQFWNDISSFKEQLLKIREQLK